MSKFEDFLKGAKKEGAWQEAVKVGKEGAREFPDGTYIVQLTAAELGQSKKLNMQVVWTHLILEGDMAGQEYKDFLGLQNKLGLQPLEWRLRALGCDPEAIDIEQLEDILQALVAEKMIMKISLKTTGEYQNMRVESLLPNYDPEDAAGYASTTVEEQEVVDSAHAGDDEPEEEEELEVLPGTKISYTVKGTTKVGIVESVDEESGQITVKSGTKPAETISGGQVNKVIPEKLDGEE